MNRALRRSHAGPRQSPAGTRLDGVFSRNRAQSRRQMFASAFDAWAVNRLMGRRNPV